MRVSLATDKSTRDASNKKHGSTKVFETNATGQSTSPGPDAAGSPETTKTGEDTAHTKRERTIALLDLPETVNDARIHSLFETVGPVKKLTVRRDKAGAMIEFANERDAGRAGFVDVSSLGGRVGTVAELFAKGEKSSGGSEAGKMVRPALVSRPGQRGGRRGGLGARKVVGGISDDAGKGEKGEKSNADFRAMFLAGKKEGA